MKKREELQSAPRESQRAPARIGGKQNQGWASRGMRRVLKKEEASRFEITHWPECVGISRSRENAASVGTMGVD